MESDMENEMELIVRNNVEFCTGAWAWLEIWPKISVRVFE